jgi:hypothetical protein
MTSLLKPFRPSFWTGWSSSPRSLTTMEIIILNEPTVSGIALIGVEKGYVVMTFWPPYTVFSYVNYCTCAPIKYPQETVWCHLHSMGFVVKHLRLVPHTLSPVQKNKRVECSMDLERTLNLAKHRGWRYFLTSDESWFYFTIDHEQI